MQRPTYSSSSSSSDSDDSSDRGQAEGGDEPSLIDEAGRAELDAFYRNAVKEQTGTAAHQLQQMLPGAPLCECHRGIHLHAHVADVVYVCVWAQR